MISDPLVEAAAMVTWGKPPKRVVAFLVESGIDGRTARERVRDFCIQRRRHIERRGVIKIGCGIAGIVAWCVGFVVLWVLKEELPYMFASKALRLALFVGALGVVFLVSGVIDCAFSDSDERPLSVLE